MKMIMEVQHYAFLLSDHKRKSFEIQEEKGLPTSQKFWLNLFVILCILSTVG